MAKFELKLVGGSTVPFVEAGDHAVYACHMTPNLSQEVFLISDDRNIELHDTYEGKGIVQGVAIMTAVNTAVSMVKPGFVIAKIKNVCFKQPVFAGEITHVEVSLSQSRGSIANIVVEVRKADGSVIIPAMSLTVIKYVTEEKAMVAV